MSTRRQRKPRQREPLVITIQEVAIGEDGDPTYEDVQQITIYFDGKTPAQVTDLT